MEGPSTPSRLQLARVRGQKSGTNSPRPPADPQGVLQSPADKPQAAVGLNFGSPVATLPGGGGLYQDGNRSARASGQGEARLDDPSVGTHDRIKALLKEFEVKVSSIHTELLTGNYGADENGGGDIYTGLASPLGTDALKDFSEVETEMNNIMFSVSKGSPEKPLVLGPSSPEKALEMSSLLRLQFEQNKQQIEKDRLARQQSEKSQRAGEEQLLAQERKQRAEFLRQQDEIHNRHMAEIKAHQDKLAKQREELQKLSPQHNRSPENGSSPTKGSPKKGGSPKKAATSLTWRDPQAPTNVPTVLPTSPARAPQIEGDQQPPAPPADTSPSVPTEGAEQGGAGGEGSLDDFPEGGEGGQQVPPPPPLTDGAAQPAEAEGAESPTVGREAEESPYASAEEEVAEGGEGGGEEPVPAVGAVEEGVGAVGAVEEGVGAVQEAHAGPSAEEAAAAAVAEAAAKEADELRKQRNRARAEELFGPIQPGAAAPGRGTVRSLDDSVLSKKGQQGLKAFDKAIEKSNDCDFEDDGGDDFVSELTGKGWVRDAQPEKGCLAGKKKKEKKKGVAIAEGDDEIPKAPEPPKDRKSIIGCWLAPVVEALNPNEKTQYSLTYVQTPQGILVNSPGGWVPPDVHPFVQEQNQILSLVKEHPDLQKKPAEVVKAVALVQELGMEPAWQDPAASPVAEEESEGEGEEGEGEKRRGLKWAEGVATEDGNTAKTLSERKAPKQDPSEEYKKQLEHFKKLPVEQQQMMQLQWQMQQLHMQAAVRQQMGLPPSEEMLVQQQRILHAYNALQAQVLAQQEAQQKGGTGGGGAGGAGGLSSVNEDEGDEEEVEDRDDDIIEVAEGAAGGAVPAASPIQGAASASARFREKATPGGADGAQQCAVQSAGGALHLAIPAEGGERGSPAPPMLFKPNGGANAGSPLQGGRGRGGGSPPGTGGSPMRVGSPESGGGSPLQQGAPHQQYYNPGPTSKSTSSPPLAAARSPLVQRNAAVSPQMSVTPSPGFANKGFAGRSSPPSGYAPAPFSQPAAFGAAAPKRAVLPAVARDASTIEAFAAAGYTVAGAGGGGGGAPANPRDAPAPSPRLGVAAPPKPSPQITMAPPPQHSAPASAPAPAPAPAPHGQGQGQEQGGIVSPWKSGVVGQLQQKHREDMARLKSQMQSGIVVSSSASPTEGPPPYYSGQAQDNEALLKRQQEEIQRATQELEGLQRDLMRKHQELQSAVNQNNALQQQRPSEQPAGLLQASQQKVSQLQWQLQQQTANASQALQRQQQMIAERQGGGGGGGAVVQGGVQLFGESGGQLYMSQPGQPTKAPSGGQGFSGQQFVGQSGGQIVQQGGQQQFVGQQGGGQQVMQPKGQQVEYVVQQGGQRQFVGQQGGGQQFIDVPRPKGGQQVEYVVQQGGQPQFVGQQGGGQLKGGQVEYVVQQQPQQQQQHNIIHVERVPSAASSQNFSSVGSQGSFGLGGVTVQGGGMQGAQQVQGGGMQGVQQVQQLQQQPQGRPIAGQGMQQSVPGRGLQSLPGARLVQQQPQQQQQPLHMSQRMSQGQPVRILQG